MRSWAKASQWCAAWAEIRVRADDRYASIAGQDRIGCPAHPHHRGVVVKPLTSLVIFADFSGVNVLAMQSATGYLVTVSGVGVHAVADVACCL